MLEIKELVVIRRGNSILNNISFSVKQCERVGLVGPSGSGKSTLLRCIQGLEQVDSGSVKCLGDIGFLFQDFQLFPHMTVLENIIYAPIITKKYSEKDALLFAKEVLIRLGIASLETAFPSQLSGGQKQRVALARAMAMSPALLLCDEPTSGLDVKSTEGVGALLTNITTLGITAIIASHELPFLLQVCTRILVLSQGKIIYDLPSEAFTEKMLEECY